MNSVALFRDLIYSSPNCCITSSEPSCHVHHTELFIIPDTQRMQTNEQMIMMKQMIKMQDFLQISKPLVDTLMSTVK